MTDRRVTLVMVGSERDKLVEALDALIFAPGGERLSGVNEQDWLILERHRDRLRAARVGSWGKR